MNDEEGAADVSDDRAHVHPQPVAAKSQATVADRLEAQIDRGAVLEQQLVAQEKLASLGALMAGIVHELRNPLNFVINFGDLLRDLAAELGEVVKSAPEGMGAQTAETIDDMLGEIIEVAGKVADHGRKATGIVESVLQQARTGEPVFEPTDLNALTQEYVNLAYHGARAQFRGFRVSVKTEYDPTLEAVVLDPRALGRVVLNLVSNALHATREAALSQKVADYAPAITVTTKDRGDSVEIAVKDNGMGIAEADLARVVEPFFTTKLPGEGTGLGLSISREIVEVEHRGSLRIGSRVGEGTEVVVEVPKGRPWGR
ncbi:sensor histidine kinase [Mycobacterium spongiae]|uniref:histidine kinase n=1 Tax=Mycobacterium spongiae TaxID=886343 RepID=A0A975K0K2_9MYCO|nr:ATP-binding protein [Mycobacterium spongiae]QUR68735.1 hypothetical protein F6B93_18130 [Mycobacterium spongiae]